MSKYVVTLLHKNISAHVEFIVHAENIIPAMDMADALAKQLYCSVVSVESADE